MSETIELPDHGKSIIDLSLLAEPTKLAIEATRDLMLAERRLARAQKTVARWMALIPEQDRHSFNTYTNSLRALMEART